MGFSHLTIEIFSKSLVNLKKHAKKNNCSQLRSTQFNEQIKQRNQENKNKFPPLTIF